jgi:hypothetical protein
MPKLALDDPMPLIELAEADARKRVYSAVFHNWEHRSAAIKALDVILPLMQRAFPAGARLDDLIYVVEHATVDACHAEISFQTSFDDEIDTYCVYFPGRPNACLHRRHITKPVEWTGKEWRRAA